LFAITYVAKLWLHYLKIGAINLTNLEKNSYEKLKS